MYFYYILYYIWSVQNNIIFYVFHNYENEFQERIIAFLKDRRRINMPMRYAAIRTMDVSNGAGLGVSLFTQGCRNRCPHCHNLDQWSFDGGEEFTQESVEKIMDLCSADWVKRFSVLGGEPLEPENHQQLLQLLRQIKQAYPHITIWLYTGFVLEDLTRPYCRANTPYINDILSQCDIVVDGPYIEAKKNIALRFAGSENQRVIDMNKTRAAGRIILWEDDPLFNEHMQEQMSALR